MQNLPNHIKTVILDSTGEITKSKWIGTFRVKCLTSHSDKFAVQRVYSSLLPTNTDNDELRVRAATLAELAVRVVDGPTWWESTGKGMYMADVAPLYKLLELCNSAADEWAEELEKQSIMGEGDVTPNPKYP